MADPRPRSRRLRRPRPSCTGCLVVVALVAVAAALVAVALWSLLRNRDNPAGLPDALRPPTTLPAAAEALPEGTYVYDSDRTGSFELYAAPVDGGQPPRRLTEDGRYDSWGARLSPDRRTLVFSRTPAGTHDDDPSGTSIWAVGSDGTGLVQLRAAGTDGWAVQGHPDWSPDGRRLVLHGGAAGEPQVHVTDAVGRSPRLVTTRSGPALDPSWAPDGATIVFVGCPDGPCDEAAREVYRQPVEGGGEVVRLTDDERPDADPHLSPDGTRLLWRTHARTAVPDGWDLMTAGPRGEDPKVLVGDGTSGGATWTAGGTRVLLTRVVPGMSPNIWTVAADGTDVRPLTTSPADTNERPTG